MSIWVELVCDQCSASGPRGAGEHWVGTSPPSRRRLRQEAKLSGWTRWQDKDGKMTDLCAACTNARKL